MNHEAVMIRLRMLTQAVEGERLKLLPLAVPPKPGTHAHGQVAVKIEGWQREAELIERALKSRQALADLHYTTQRFGPRPWAARQRHRSVSANVDAAAQACERFALAVAKLYRDLHVPSRGGALGAGAGDALGNLIKGLDTDGDKTVSAEEVQALIGQLSGDPVSGPPPQPAAYGTGLITLAVFLLTLLKRRRGD